MIPIGAMNANFSGTDVEIVDGAVWWEKTALHIYEKCAVLEFGD